MQKFLKVRLLMNPKIIVYQLVFLLFCFQASGQKTDSMLNKLAAHLLAINNFSKHIPQEKVYLHFDNTSYYHGDNIWFKCYVENSGLHGTVQLSKTLYVELLNPGGEVIDKRILKIENGQCHGDFSLNRIPFYSGFYEVRAYTKYMLNFGDEVIFSRLLPVFDKPKEEGAFEERNMLRYGKYGYNNYPMIREYPQQGKAVNLKFFPEGGNLVLGIESLVAFEATDELGNPIAVTGTVVNKTKDIISDFSVMHEGKGVFHYTPNGDNQNVIVDYNGKKYQFDMPPALSQGIVMKVDNLSYPDSIEMILQKNKDAPAGLIGMAVIGGGKLKNYCLVDIPDHEIISFKIDKAKLSSGVSQIVLFNMNGDIICDRLIFTYKTDKILDIKSTTEKRIYKPHELVDMEFTVTDKNANPVPIAFSLSIKDGLNEIDNKHNILTYFLLTSEIKGYVRNPSYYFESDDDERRTNLDLLLMVQGWRRHIWKQMIGKEPLDLKYLPEQGIEITGQVMTMLRSVPEPGVEISMLLDKKEVDDTGNFFGFFVTDSLGRFTFVSDVYGKWDMILAVQEKGRKRNHRITLDRVFSPNPKRYQYVEMHTDIVDEREININDEYIYEEITEDMDSTVAVYKEFQDNVGIDQKIHQISEVVVTAKKTLNEQYIYDNRSKSVAYYDINAELDNLKDQNYFIGGDNINELLLNMNKNFYWDISKDGVRFFSYKGKLPLFIINYEQIKSGSLESEKYSSLESENYINLRLDAIKSIYINENMSIASLYADPEMNIFDIHELYGCVVFIETYPEGKIPAETNRGVRKTKLEGYNRSMEFYNNDYSELPPESDYRRTLYWNPSVIPDEKGRINIQFYNNSRCKKFSISAETIAPQGLGVYNVN